MIFKRRKKQDVEAPAETEEVATDAAADESEVGEDAEVGSELDEPGDEAGEPELDTDALDAQDWRTDGPYDVSEVGLDTDDDDEEPTDADADAADAGTDDEE